MKKVLVWGLGVLAVVGVFWFVLPVHRDAYGKFYSCFTTESIEIAFTEDGEEKLKGVNCPCLFHKEGIGWISETGYPDSGYLGGSYTIKYCVNSFVARDE